MLVLYVAHLLCIFSRYLFYIYLPDATLLVFSLDIYSIFISQTRVLVTHGLQWLPAVDRIIVVEDSTITHQGSYHDLIKDGGHVADLLLSSDHVISSGEPDQQSGTESLMGETEAGKIKKEKLGNGQGGLLTEEKTAVSISGTL